MDWDKNGYVTPIEFKSYLAELKKGEDINPDEVYEAFEQARAFPNFCGRLLNLKFSRSTRTAASASTGRSSTTP